MYGLKSQFVNIQYSNKDNIQTSEKLYKFTSGFFPCLNKVYVCMCVYVCITKNQLKHAMTLPYVLEVKR